MPKPTYLLTFVAGDKGEIFVHADHEGLTKLIGSLERLRKSIEAGNCDHDHLMTDAWGGTELSEEKGMQTGELIHHVELFGWTKEWVTKHGFARRIE